MRIDLSVNKNDIESLTIQIVFKKKKKKDSNTLINAL